MNAPPPSWLPLVAAGATLFAALVALFKEDIVKWWRHPDLTMRMLLASPDCVLMPIVVRYREQYLPPPSGTLIPSIPPEMREVQWNGHSYFFRLWIENNGDFGERVQVYVESVRRQMGDGHSEIVPEFIPMNLRWADSLDPSNPLIFESINPKMGRYCDFAAISEPASPLETLREGMDQGQSTFTLQTQVAPNSEGNRLKPGNYLIRLLLAASNSRPKAFTVNLEWSGRYLETPERMFSEAVKLRISG